MPTSAAAGTRDEGDVRHLVRELRRVRLDGASSLVLGDAAAELAVEVAKLSRALRLDRPRELHHRHRVLRDVVDVKVVVAAADGVTRHAVTHHVQRRIGLGVVVGETDPGRLAIGTAQRDARVPFLGEGRRDDASRAPRPTREASGVSRARGLATLFGTARARLGRASFAARRGVVSPSATSPPPSSPLARRSTTEGDENHRSVSPIDAIWRY